MKNIIISATVMVLVLVSCNQKSKQDDTTNTPMMEHDSTMMHKDSTMVKDAPAKIYACPMHPEVKGKSTDKCSKCGMDLTVEVN